MVYQILTSDLRRQKNTWHSFSIVYYNPIKILTPHIKGKVFVKITLVAILFLSRKYKNLYCPLSVCMWPHCYIYAVLVIKAIARFQSLFPNIVRPQINVIKWIDKNDEETRQYSCKQKNSWLCCSKIIRIFQHSWFIEGSL